MSYQIVTYVFLVIEEKILPILVLKAVKLIKETKTCIKQHKCLSKSDIVLHLLIFLETFLSHQSKWHENSCRYCLIPAVLAMVFIHSYTVSK